MKKKPGKPSHYGDGVDPLDLIAAAGERELRAFCMGNVLKYVFRYNNKSKMEERLRDLNKARFYLEVLTGLENWRASSATNCGTNLPSPKELREKYGRT